MEFDPERVYENVHQAETSELLGRLTFLRDEMEPEALNIIKQELRARDIDPDSIELYVDLPFPILRDEKGNAYFCHHCRRPAVSSKKGWFRLFRIVPVFPITEYCCEAHTPQAVETPSE